ncbi:hypothetical protein C5C10_03195 [Rathayibacter sp. AY1A3]|nr:hypothetical protein C5C10_03195 [Rathayibacter sp. AY1A3]
MSEYPVPFPGDDWEVEVYSNAVRLTLWHHADGRRVLHGEVKYMKSLVKAPFLPYAAESLGQFPRLNAALTLGDALQALI